jgi:hypothetical protein
MKVYGGVDVYIHIFLTSALVGVSGQLHAPTLGERAPSTHWIGGWMGPRAGLDDVENRKYLILPGLTLQHLSCPARSQSLYQLSYTGSTMSLWPIMSINIMYKYNVTDFMKVHIKLCNLIIDDP